MSLVRILLTRGILPGALVALIAGCATTPRVPPPPAVVSKPPAPPPATTPIETPPPLIEKPQPAESSGPPIDPAAAPVVARLATQLRLAPEQIEVVRVAPAEWPNACLGVPAEGEICGMMITPGFSVTLAEGGRTYEYRTDAAGHRIRLAAAPPPETGEPLVTWRDNGSFSSLIVGTKRVAFGRRGCPMLALALPVPARAEELRSYLARFSPFQANTKSGEIGLRGIGETRATPIEQRIIAEWARLVSAEVEGGFTDEAPDRAIIWRRTGGIVGFCDSVVIGHTGTATAYSCRSGEDRRVAQIRLEPGELEQVFRWLDGFDSFTWTSGDGGAVADAMIQQLDMAGEGIEPLPSTEREHMLSLINSLVRRLVAKSSGS